MYTPYGFIYITTNLVNGKQYIGQCCYKKRDRRTKRNWETYLGSGKALLRAVKKYGKESFTREILCVTFSLEDSNFLEELILKEYDAVANPNFYNMADKAYNTKGFEGKHHTEEHKKYMSEKYLANHPNKGKSWSSEVRKHMSEAQLKREKIPYSEERITHIKNLGLANRGRKWSDETRQKIKAQIELNRTRCKTWRLKNHKTGEELIISDLPKWCLENGVLKYSLRNTRKRGTPLLSGWQLYEP